MSEVYYWKRKTTPGKFVETAKDLKLLICRAVANANAKQYGVYGAGKLVDYVCELRRLTAEANFKPRYEREVFIRYEKLIRARQAFRNVVMQFGDTCELMGFSDSIKDRASELMEKENALLDGVIDSDRELYSSILSKLDKK